MGNAGSCVSGEKEHPKLCSQDSINYIVEKTQASKEDVEAYQANFLQNYPDGKIDKSGFSDMMKMAYPDQDIDKLKDHIFRMYDANDDGKIDFKEFMIVLTVISKGTPEENLEQIFRIFDVNNDGHISKKELYRVVKDLYTLMGKEDNPDQETEKTLTDMAFTEMDVDGDSKISRDEFVRASQGNERITSMLTLKIVDIFVPQ